MDESLDGWKEGQMGGWIDGPMDGSVDGWVEEWMDDWRIKFDEQIKNPQETQMQEKKRMGIREVDNKNYQILIILMCLYCQIVLYLAATQIIH